jgi:hypothetical protein
MARPAVLLHPKISDFRGREYRYPVFPPYLPDTTPFDVGGETTHHTSVNENHGGTGREEVITLTLYVQTPVSGVRTETIDRLTALSVERAIEEFDVQTVREEFIVSQGRDEETSDLPGEFDALTEWRERDVQPTFEVESGWTRTGRTVRTLSLPEMVLAVYTADDLACVFPCTDGAETWTVEEFLDQYESSRELPNGLDVDLAE